jgi:hypothetical protein
VFALDLMSTYEGEHTIFGLLGLSDDTEVQQALEIPGSHLNGLGFQEFCHLDCRSPLCVNKEEHQSWHVGADVHRQLAVVVNRISQKYFLPLTICETMSLLLP